MESRAIRPAPHQFGVNAGDSGRGIVFHFGASLSFCWASPAARRHIGMGLRDLLDRRPWDIKPCYTRATFERLLQPLRDGAPSVYFHADHQRADGTVVPVAITLRRHVCDGAELFAAAVEELGAPLAAHRVERARQGMRLSAQASTACTRGELLRLAAMLDSDALALRAGAVNAVAANLVYYSSWLSDTFGAG